MSVFSRRRRQRGTMIWSGRLPWAHKVWYVKLYRVYTRPEKSGTRAHAITELGKRLIPFDIAERSSARNGRKTEPDNGRPDMLRRVRLLDIKTDIFLAANIMDATLTYVALQHRTQLTEFNPIISGLTDTIGTGTVMFLKVIPCIGILWMLRKTKKENLLVPLSVVLVVVALANLLVIRAQGIEV